MFAMRVFTSSGLFMLACFAIQISRLPVPVIVSSAYPLFLSWMRIFRVRFALFIIPLGNPLVWFGVKFYPTNGP